MRPSSSLFQRRRFLIKDIVRSERWSHRTRVVVWIVLLAVIVLEGVLIMQPSESSQHEADLHSTIRATPTSTIRATPHSRPRAMPTRNGPVSTVLPPASPPTTLGLATAAEQSAFNAGQHSCQLSSSTTFAPASAVEQAAFKAGHQWCHSLTTVGHHASASKR